MARYDRFDAWKACHELVVAVYRVTKAWPPEERYGLTDQLRRAAFSAANNIAEGSAKRGSRELRRYLDIALGSLSEVHYILRLAGEIGIATDEDLKPVQALQEAAGRSTWLFYNSIRPR
jgi:four helix bundle protein